MATMDRRAYAETFGPTVGDRLRLADTELIVEVEKDYTLAAGGYGEEVKFGGGKTIRDGMAQSAMANQWSKLSLAPKATRVFYKDLQLCLKFAHELGLPAPAAALAQQLLDEIVP